MDDLAEIGDHQQNWGYEDGPWKGPGPPLLVAADFLLRAYRKKRKNTSNSIKKLDKLFAYLYTSI